MILNIYSHYTKPEGSVKFTDLAAMAREKKLKSLALTDHGNFSGIIEFYNNCLLNGIKPIIGLDFFYQLSDGTYVRLILYIRNYEGYAQILKLVPDLETGFDGCSILGRLKTYQADNLFCLINLYKVDYYSDQLNMSKNPAQALKEVQAIGNFNAVFFQLLKDEHEDNDIIRNSLIKISAENNKIRLAAVNPVFYLNKQDYKIKEFLLSHYKNHQSSRSYQNQFPESILLNEHEFPQEALANRGYISDQCNLLLDQLPIFFPDICWRLPDTQTALEKLSELVGQNLLFYYSSHPDLAKFEERIEYEFNIIKQQKLAVYFYFLHLFREKFVDDYKCRIYFGGQVVYFFIAYMLRLTISSPLSFRTNYSKAILNNQKFFPVIIVNIGVGQKSNLRNLLSEVFGNEKICNLVDFAQWNAASLISALGKYQNHSKEAIDNLLKSIPARYRFEPIKNMLRLENFKNLISENYASKELMRFAWLLDETSRIALPDSHSLVIGHHNVEEMLPVHAENETTGCSRKTFYDLETAKFFGVWTMQINSFKALDILDQAAPFDSFLKEEDIANLSNELEKSVKNKDLDFLPFISWREDKLKILGLFGNHHLYNLALYMESYLFSLEQLEAKPDCESEKSLQLDLKYTGGKIVFYEQFVHVMEKLFKEKEYLKVKKLIYGSKNVHYLKKMLNNLIKNKQDQQNVKWLQQVVLPSAFLTNLGETAFRLFITMKMLSAKKASYTEFVMHSFIEAINSDTADYDKFLPAVQKLGITVLPITLESMVRKAFYNRDRQELTLPAYVIRGITPHLSEYLYEFSQSNEPFSSLYHFFDLVDIEQIKLIHCELLAKIGFFDGLVTNRKAAEETIRNYYETDSRKADNQSELFAMDTFLPKVVEIADYTISEKRDLELKLTGFIFTPINRLDIADFTEHLLIPDRVKIVYFLKVLHEKDFVLFENNKGEKAEFKTTSDFVIDEYHPYFLEVNIYNQTISNYKIISNPWQDLAYQLYFTALSSQTDLLDKVLSFSDQAGTCSFVCYLSDLGREISGSSKLSINKTRMKDFIRLLKDNPYYLQIINL